MMGVEESAIENIKILRALKEPQRFDDLCLTAHDNPDDLDGDLKITANHFKSMKRNNEDHFQNALTGAAHALSGFRPGTRLGALGASHAYDLAKRLRDETKPPTVVFDITPTDKIKAMAKPNALIQSARLQALQRRRDGRDILYVLDEATNLPLPDVTSSLELLRGLGIFTALFYQSFGSLKRVYGEREAQAILSSSTEIYFGVADLERATQISQRIGNKTLKVKTQSFDEEGKPGMSFNQTPHPLFTPDKILSMGKDKAFMLTQGLRPALFDKVAYFEAEPFKSMASPNPHENHPPSSRVAYHLQYGKDATALGPPRLVGHKRFSEAARKKDTAERKRPKVRIVRITDFLWVPIISGAAAAILMIGTPHILLESLSISSNRPSTECLYVGLSGMRHVKQNTRCATFKTFRF